MSSRKFKQSLNIRTTHTFLDAYPFFATTNFALSTGLLFKSTIIDHSFSTNTTQRMKIPFSSLITIDDKLMWQLMFFSSLFSFQEARIKAQKRRMHVMPKYIFYGRGGCGWWVGCLEELMCFVWPSLLSSNLSSWSWSSCR